MSTRLSGIQIPVELDTKQAERKLDDLERHLHSVEQGRAGVSPGGSGGSGHQSHGSGGESYALAPKGPTGPYSYDLASKHSYSLKPSAPSSGATVEDLKKEAQVKFGLDDEFSRLVRIDRIRKFARAHLTEAARKESVMGKVGGLVQEAVGPIEKAGIMSKSTLGVAGAIYAAASLGSKAAAPIAAGLAAFSGSPFKAIQDQLDHFRAAFQYMESYVKTALSATSKTYEIAEAEAYITGRVPNIGVVYGYQRRSELYEDQLGKRLGNFKSDNLAQSIGMSLEDMTKQGFNK